MSDVQDNNQEENKQNGEEQKAGLGLFGKTVSLAGGVAGGVVANKGLVSHGIKSNLLESYPERTQAHFDEQVKAKGSAENFLAEPKGSSAGGTPKDRVQKTAMEHVRGAATPVHNSVMASSDTPTAQALKEKGSVLNKAFSDMRTHSGDTSHKFRQKLNAAYDRSSQKLGEHAEKVLATVGTPDHKAAAEGLVSAIVKEADSINHLRAKQVVREVSWVTRLNPFSKDLHLNGKQKTLAVVGGAATALIGAFGLGKVGQWMFSGKDQDNGQER